MEGLATLRAARTAWAFEELAARGGLELAEPGIEASAELMERSLTQSGADPEVAAFVAEVQFLSDYRAGVGALAGSRTPIAAAEAVRNLNRALSARPERADLHWYMAEALERLDRPEAAEARQRARELCPRIDQTPAGLRVSSWH
jgi:hypothetical protein